MAPVHPGAVLKGLYLEPLEINITQAANKLGVARKTLSQLINQCRLLTGSPEHFRFILNPSPKEKDFDAQRKTAFFKPLSLGEGFGVRRTRCQAQILIP